MPGFTLKKATQRSYEDVLARVPELLKAEGFNLTSGIAMLVASTFAGLLWDRLGASSTFYAGVFFCGTRSSDSRGDPPPSSRGPDPPATLRGRRVAELAVQPSCATSGAFIKLGCSRNRFQYLWRNAATARHPDCRRGCDDFCRGRGRVLPRDACAGAQALLLSACITGAFSPDVLHGHEGEPLDRGRP
jgi:hypothetical protein